MKKVAIIDIGSKSIKFFVGEKAEDGSIRTLLDTNDIAALGEGLSKTGRISDEALERNAQSVSAFAAKVAAIVVFAAMAGYLIFIDNPYFDDTPEMPGPAASSAAAKNISAGKEPVPLYPDGVDIRNLRLAAAGEPAAFRFTIPSAAAVKAEHAAEIPEAVKHVWLFNSAGKTETFEKPLRNALETAGIPLDQVRIAVTPERGLRVNLQLTRRQCVMLTRQLAQQFQLVSPTQPQPEQHLFAGTGEELVEYEAVLLPRE